MGVEAESGAAVTSGMSLSLISVGTPRVGPEQYMISASEAYVSRSQAANAKRKRRHLTRIDRQQSVIQLQDRQVSAGGEMAADPAARGPAAVAGLAAENMFIHFLLVLAPGHVFVGVLFVRKRHRP